MKIDRLLHIITLLQRYPKLTIAELAERFEVSRRTISRDLNVLLDAGIPLIITSGWQGGIQLDPQFRLDRTLLTASDLQALISGLDGLDSVSKTAPGRKLLEKLSLKPLEDPEMLVDLASHYKDSLAGKIQDIRQAVRERRVLHFDYDSPSGHTHRQAEPCYLIYRWSSWYCYAWCLIKEDYRMFKLNRLWQLKITEQPCTHPRPPRTSLKLDRWLQSPAVTLMARFTYAARWRLVEEYGPDSFRETADGHLELRRDFANPNEMKQWILSFGSQAEVLEPQTLRIELEQEAHKMLQFYQQR